MHPVRHLGLDVAAPTWSLVWLAVIALWIGALATSGVERIELLTLSAPDLPARTWPSYRSDVRDHGAVGLRDPFTPPAANTRAATPICGIRSR